MKKCRVLLIILVIVGIVSSKCLVAEAAENEIQVVQVGRTVELLSDEELNEMSHFVMEENSEIMTADVSYTAYRYTDAFNFYLNGDWVARADAECIVWHYTDGKVHLYQRSIQVTKLISIGAARIYGSIINTDGSCSYTLGDRVHLYLDEGTWSYGIDFYVSGDDGQFRCYRAY